MAKKAVPKKAAAKPKSKARPKASPKQEEAKKLMDKVEDFDESPAKKSRVREGDAVIKKFEQMQKKKILIFAGMGMQSQFDTIHGFVKSLKAGLCPAVGKAGDSSFMQQVTMRLSLFLKYKQGDSLLSGNAAAKAMMQDIANAHDADMTKVKYDEVATLLCFSWLLEPSQLTKLRAIQNRLGANKVGQLTAAAKTKAKKRAQSPAESKQTLAALFSRE
jgi:hypothetical protein